MQNQALNILFGFEESKFQRDVERALTGYGYTPNIVCKYSKLSIAKFVKENPSFNIVVLKELVGRTPYTDVELADLTEERDINVIVVLTARHKGTSYMETLYSAGITGVLFQDGTTTDASVEKVVDLILHKRRRIDARKYYGIREDTGVQVDKISDDKLSDLLHALDDSSYGEDIGTRFAMLCQTLSVRQTCEFIKKLPADVKASLEGCDNYWLVIAALEKHGVKIRSQKYEDKLKNFSKRAKVEASKQKRLDAKSLESEYAPSNPVAQTSTKAAEDADPSKEDEFVTEEELEREREEENETDEPATPPSTTDWRELKKWQKEQDRLAKKKKKKEKYKKLPPVEENVQKQSQKVRGPISREKSDNKEILMKIGIAVGILLFIGLLVIVIIGVNYMTRTNAMENAKQQELLSEQMSDLAFIRSGEEIDTTDIIPATTSVVNGEQLMGLSVMDIINTDVQLFYVVNIDGSLYTYEGGGATSSEIIVESMYYAQLLPSGHFAFYQQ